MKTSWESVAGLALAAVLAVSMWFYVNSVLRARQIAEAHARQIPRGNLSDLYPRWLGARELLLHHRNPYGDDISLQIQEGYYGRRLDASRPSDPKDQQGFAYPVYVVFLLAPTIWFPFPALQVAFYWALGLLTGVSVCLWLRVLRWRLSTLQVLICVTLTLGTFAAVQGIKLQQLSLLVAALIAGSVACVTGGYLFTGGVLLALTTIKPQLAWALTGWLLLWAISDWRKRRRIALGFGTGIALLFGGAEMILPGWWRMFTDAVSRYHQYTQNESVLDELVPFAFAGKALALLAVLASVRVLFKMRRVNVGDRDFGRSTALVLALTVLVVPMYAPYNQVLLVPVILTLARDWRWIALSRGLRFVLLLAVSAFVWQWVGSLTLTAGYIFLSAAWAFDRWDWPFFATFALPVLAFALILIEVRNSGKRRKALPVSA